MQQIFEHQSLVYVIYSGLALGVLLVLTALGQLLGGGENLSEAKSRRMRMIAQGKSTGEVLALLKPKTDGGILTRLPLIGDLPTLIRQAGLIIPAQTFVLLCLAATLSLMIIGLGVTEPLQAVTASIAIGLVMPVIVLRYKRDKLSDALVQQLPDALDLMARGLRVGHPLNTSIGAVAREMPDPIGTEFGIVFDQVNYGDDLVDAFQEFSERVNLEDVSYLSASIGIQHGTGGDLATIVQTLSNVIRNRIAMRRKIRAISSEGRLSAWFLSSLPVIIFSFTSMTTPDYYGGVSQDPLFAPMAATVVVFTILNLLILRKLVNFRI